MEAQNAMPSAATLTNDDKSHQFAKFVESVKSQSVIQLDQNKPKKDSAANYDLDSIIPRIFHSNRRDLMTFKGKDLPKGFEQFTSTPLCRDMCESILDYCKYLIKLDGKKQQLEEDAKLRGIPPPKVLRSEFDKLNVKAKRMADCYVRLIFKFRSTG